MGRFSKEWIYFNCNVSHHCLGVRLVNPIFDGRQEVLHVYLTEVKDLEFFQKLSKKHYGDPEDFEGSLMVQAFTQEPSDSRLIELSMNNIDSISKI